mmetsp:Transcript_11179/g.36801  ORF Transcript_11179/g.36801 Transcript_11179/m.36801 type:complete len:230 (-) Transcript_11179:1397-2086(-)
MERDVMESVSVMQSSRHSSKLKRRIFFSEHTVTIQRPSLVIPRSLTRAPFQRWSSWPLRSHIKMCLSKPPETMRLPSGIHAAAVTWSVCFRNTWRHRPEDTSQSRTVLSLLHVSRCSSLGDHERKARASSWPVRVSKHAPVEGTHTLIVLSKEHEMMRWSVIVNFTSGTMLLCPANCATHFWSDSRQMRRSPSYPPVRRCPALASVCGSASALTPLRCASEMEMGNTTT